MKALCKVLAIVGGVLISGYLVAESSPKKEARVTRIIRDVKVLPSGSPAQPAALEEMVRENRGVRTGDESHSELTFVDLTITRLGANTVFSFSRAGRSAELGMARCCCAYRKIQAVQQSEPPRSGWESLAQQ
jgi:hypothetical protein